MPALRPIGPEDRLSIVDHLDELRGRLIVIIVAFVAVFAFCYAENGRILKIVNKPFAEAQHSSKNHGSLQQSAVFQKQLGIASVQLATTLKLLQGTITDLAAQKGLSPGERQRALATALQTQRAATAFLRVQRTVPKDTGKRPVTLGVAEPFTATFTVAGYAAILLILPLILFQMYAFVLPAFQPEERKIAIPLMSMVPVLFIGGVLFGYFVALPRAVDFLQNFNSDQFDILIQAQVYYRFVVLFLALMGLIFQIPVGVLALTRAGIVSAQMLWKRQGYVILGISIVAAVATPTPDPVTMLVTMLPLVLLFELSIGLAYLFRPRGGTVGGRWSEWWDDEDEDDDEDDHDPDGPVAGSLVGRTPVS